MRLRLLLDDLKQMEHIPTVIIESYDQSLYQCFVVIDEQEVLVWASQEQALKSRSLMAMREQLAPLLMGELFLRQSSAYDEMVNQPERAGPNTMLVPLGHP